MRDKLLTLFIVAIVLGAVVGLITIGAGANQDTILDRQSDGEVPSNITLSDTEGGPSDANGIESNSEQIITYTIIADKQTNINNTKLEKFGEVETTSGRLVEIRTSPKHQENISDISWVVEIREASQPVRGDVDGSGNISSLGVERLHQRGVTGEGVKIGVIDSGFDTESSSIRNNIAGERRFSQSSSLDHGTAVAQVVTKTAPDASLYLATAQTTTDVAASLDYFSEQGVDIVVMSVSYPTLNDDGNHILAQPIADARSDGILYINNAGNYRNKHWEGPFTDNDDDRFHEFNDNIDERNCIPSCERVAVSGQFRATLDWEREGDGSKYRIGLYDPTTQEVFASSYERFGSASHNRQWIDTQIRERPVDLIIQNTEGPPNDDLELYVYNRPLERSIGTSSVAPPADTPESVSVAAYARSQGQTTEYSSMGPTDAGRTEPTVTGYTNIEVSRYEGVFAGTSSAAPYVAGVAALIQGASSEDQTPADLSKALTSTADDIGYEGFDTVSGAGVINATKAVQEGVNLPPEADAGPDQNVTSQEAVVLDGTNSSDPDSETFNFNWKQTAGPPVSLSSSGTLRPSFEAPNVKKPISIQFELILIDSSGNSDSDKVNISVLPTGSISGSVVDTEANPIPGAQVRITSASGSVIAETTTDSSGTYTVEVPPDEYTVIVESNGSTTGQTVLVEPGATINADIVIQTAASESVFPSVGISNAPDRIGPNETFVIEYEVENTGTVTGPFVLDVPAPTPGVTVQDIDGDIQGSDTSAEPVTAATNRIGPNETVAVSVTYDASDLSSEDITLELTARQPLDSTSDSVSSTITVTESTDPTERALQRFDGDGDGMIDRDEAVGAIVAYNIGTTIGGEEVTRTQVVRAVVAYNTGEPIEA